MIAVPENNEISTRGSLTYESRLVKYAMRGFQIAVPQDLLNVARVSPSMFDLATIFHTEQTKLQGLAKLLVLDRLHQRRNTKAPKLTVTGISGAEITLTPLTATSSSYHQGHAPCLPDDAEVKYLGRNYSARFPLDIVNLSEAAAQAGERDASVPNGLYGGTRECIPWRAGFDVRRLEHHVSAARAGAARSPVSLRIARGLLSSCARVVPFTDQATSAKRDVL